MIRTLFDSISGEWLLRDICDPIMSWPVKEVLEMATQHPIPKEDVYGCLYFYIRDQLEQFNRKAANTKIVFQLCAVDAEVLPSLLADNLKFDRIETSNLADDHHKGLDAVLKIFSPLLKSSSQNPYATLVTGFTNAVNVAETDLGNDYSKISMAEEMNKVMKFVPARGAFGDWSNPTWLRIIEQKDIFRDFDYLFEHYMGMVKFKEVGDAHDMVMRPMNRVIDAWPIRFKKRFGEEGAQEEFDKLFAVGNQRFVEWVRWSSLGL